jgi:ABC-type transporter Mla MlaB component
MNANNVSAFSVDLDGPQIVRNIHAAYDRLSAALAEHQSVQVHCHEITECDLSLIQLLLAAKRSADSTGKSLRLSAPADGLLRIALDRAGFLAVQGNEPNSDREFWLNGSPAQ